MINNNFFLSLIFFICTISCRHKEKDLVKDRQLLKDTGISDSGYWKFKSRYFGIGAFVDNYKGAITNEYFLSNPSSLSISRDKIFDEESYAYWYQDVLNPSIPDGSTLTFRAKIKAEIIEGQAYMFLHSLYDNDTKENGFYATSGMIKIENSADFKEVVFSVENYKETFKPTEKLVVGLGFDTKTAGKVYFDDIYLEITPKK